MELRESSAPSVGSEAELRAVAASEASPARFSLLDMVLEAEGRARSALDSVFLEEASVDAAIAYFRRRCGRTPRTTDELIGVLLGDVAEVDDLLNRQVNAILHNPRFQRLEARWRGLELLIREAHGSENVRIAVLTLGKDELASDLCAALEFDQSEFFKKIYEEEYGMAGGEPFGVLLADYTFEKSPSDIDLLSRIAGVAAAAFAPFIGGARPEMFGIAEFGMIDRVQDLAERFEGLQNTQWNSLREREDARFLGLTLPRTLMRLPYEGVFGREEGFVFEEDVSAPDRSGYLWGNASFAFGVVLIRAFLRNAWFAGIRGTSEGPGGGGVVGFPSHSFGTDSWGAAVKCSTELAIGEFQERELSSLGFLVLSDCEDTEYSAFYATQSFQRPARYNEELATVNAQMSAMLQYIFCASRFAHYVKVIARGMVGSFSEAPRLQSYLHSWLQRYVAKDPGASIQTRARFPLRDAKVVVREHPHDPGHFLATLDVWPHFQLDELTASVKLVTDLTGPNR